MEEESSSSSPAINQALQKARYNEIVQLTVHRSQPNDSTTSDDDDGSADTVVSLVACLDRQHGGSVQWNPLPPDKLLSRHLQTKRWIFPMLNDHRRNRLYQKAIQAAAQHLADHHNQTKTAPSNDEQKDDESNNNNHNNNNSTSTSTIHAIDIGSGTGLLGMMAARSLLRTRAFDQVQVTSMEMDACMARMARQTIHDNPLENSNNNCSIRVVEGHSTELPATTVTTPKAQLGVAELLESGLLGEGILPALRDAWQRHLQVDTATIMIPQRARVYAQMVSSRHHDDNWILSNYYGPHNDGMAESFSRAACSSSSGNSPRFCCGNDAEGTTLLLLDADSVVLFVHAQKLLRQGSLVALTDPVPILELDFTFPAIHHHNKAATTPRCVSTNVTTPGTIHGVLVWWELDLWDDITYSLRPNVVDDNDNEENWQDHWHCCLHIVPREQCRAVRTGETVTVQASHTDERIFVKLVADDDDVVSNTKQEEAAAAEAKRRKTDTPPPPTTLISPFRAFQLNDSKRQSVWIQSIAHCLSQKGNDALVLDVSDFSWCACLAASLGATKVVSLETSANGDVAMTAARVAQLANNFPKKDCRFDILQCHTEQLTVREIGGVPADIVMAEYYQVLEGWHLQEALNFYYTVRWLRKQTVISEHARILPTRCRIVACAIESAQLRSAYAPCGDSNGRLLGFDHSFVNSVGSNFRDYDLALPMWQYDYKRLSETAELTALDFEGCNEDLNRVVTSSVKFTDIGMFDAVMVWLEYYFPKEQTGSLMFATSGQSSLQLIRMAQPSLNVDASMIDCEARLVCLFSIDDLAENSTHKLEFKVESTHC